MVIFDIDYDTANALSDWYKENKIYADRCGNFYPEVQMQLRTDPCGMTVFVSKNSEYQGNTFRVKAEQLSFYKDTQLSIKNQLGIPFLKETLQLMKGEEAFYKDTIAKYSFKTRYEKDINEYQTGKYKLPTLAEYYGFSPRVVFDKVYSRLMAAFLTHENYEQEYREFCRGTLEQVHEKFREDAKFIAMTYIAANAYLYYRNKDEQRNIKALGTRDENGKKVIVFRLLKDEKGSDIYIVQTKERKDSDGKVIPVRGHLRRMQAGDWYKQSKVIWIDSFIKGLPPEYYENKRKERKGEKEDALLLNPKEFLTDCTN